ncbi:MAG: hypothetical protein WBC80_03880, partial [Isosphaeraceae bacterium]
RLSSQARSAFLSRGGHGVINKAKGKKWEVGAQRLFGISQVGIFWLLLLWHRRSSYEPDAPARGVPQSPRWRVGLVCARMRNFLAGVMVFQQFDDVSLMAA